jgi:uncharacterized damage-inducible protein DinB
MRHQREEVIERTKREFKQLDKLVSNLKQDEWDRPVPRPEGKDPWTVKDSLAHITHWKADIIRSIQGGRRPANMKGMNESQENHLIYTQHHNQPAQEVLAWHRQVQKDILKALKEAPDEWFSGRERRQEWPYDLDGHSAYHRVKDIEQALAQ